MIFMAALETTSLDICGDTNHITKSLSDGKKKKDRKHLKNIASIQH